ncbi:carbohydrate ABC transporter permease [Cohnella fermenti]|uniref:Carbohydrate ABC transporter permease n=1 Tax=Cohnella fermenti TaxID=2565925 RepID=A0A4V3WFI3_9BACL|nr:carbohydrate ABC transporter permease [Cohnella fermenti]THF80380.1 carbohydrate ABC transporter permease [Cohnella fermenti]
MNIRKRERLAQGVLLLLFALFFLFPIYWALATSFKTPGQIIKLPPEFWPTRWTWDNYREIFKENNIGLYFRNSMVVALATVGLSVLIAALAGYGFARFRFRGRRFWLYLILAVRMIPGLVFTVPYFVIFDKLGLLDSLTGLIIVYTAGTLPLAVWLFVGFYEELPGELYEAGIIDGCGPLQLFARIALPLVAPGIVVTAILAFLAAYNEFGMALILTFSDAKKTLPLGISGLVQAQKDTPFGPLAAAGTVAMLPAFLLSLTTQKYIVKGFTAGAVKG